MVPSRAVPSRSLPPLFMGSPRLRAPARAHPGGGGAGLERGGGGGAGGCPLPPVGPGTARHGWVGCALPVRLGDPVPLRALGSRAPHSAPRSTPNLWSIPGDSPPLCGPGSGTPGGHPMDTLSIRHPKAGVPIGAPWGRGHHRAPQGRLPIRAPWGCISHQGGPAQPWGAASHLSRTGTRRGLGTAAPRGAKL